MKNTFGIFITLILFATLFQSCIEDSCTDKITLTIYEPIYEDIATVRNNVKIGEASTIGATGALYYYEDYLLINEPGIGIHIYDNRDKTNPINLSTIEAQGSASLAIRNNRLYFDNFMDLYVFDVSDMSNPKFVHRMDDVFNGHYVTRDGKIVIDYTSYKKEVQYDCDRGTWIGVDFGPDVLISGQNRFFSLESFDGVANNSPSINKSNNTVGVGGSLARFTIAFDRLYVVELHGLKVFSLEQADNPQSVNEINLGWGIETIFPYKSNLFIGARTGMFIFDASNRDAPVLLSRFAHANVCDPVFATENRAYVTLRNGTECEGFTNELNVLDITELRSPILLKKYALTNPRGLSVRGDILYICDGPDGLKVFDRSDDYKIDKNQLSQKKILANDVISLSQNHLLVIGDEGLYQYDSSNPLDLKELSFIAIVK